MGTLLGLVAALALVTGAVGVRTRRRAALGAADAVRRQIERDLHDGIQQRVVSLALAVRHAQLSVPASDDTVRDELSAVAGGLSDMFEELRAITHRAGPAVLADRGLGPALHALAGRSTAPADVEVRCRAGLPQQVGSAAYYVVSEALTNVTKHASAGKVRVEVEEVDGSLGVRVVDDGVGGAAPAPGSGLAGLRDRVSALGGTLDVHSPAGGGTDLAVRMPLPGQHRPKALRSTWTACSTAAVAAAVSRSGFNIMKSWWMPS